MVASEEHAEVKLQDLLDHTATRLLQVQEPVLCQLEENNVDSFILLSKWGFDGSSGHSQYKQRAQREDFPYYNVFFTSMVPLQLYYMNCKSQKIVVWQNPKPSSTLLCRPIKFQFRKETQLLVKEEGS